MSATTAIEWTDATVNFWEGCTKVGPGCNSCYAAERDRRFHKGGHWGPGAPRRWVKGGVPLMEKLHRDAPAFEAAHRRRRRVFINSLSDFLDNEVPDEWRLTAASAIDAAPSIDVQIVTKRIGNLEKLAPAHWLKNWPRHVGLMITVVNQQEADRDIIKLLEAKRRFNIPWIGLSCEPLLGSICLTRITATGPDDGGFIPINALAPLEILGVRQPYPTVDWVIAGGESGGPESRLTPVDAFRFLRNQCAEARVPFFFKQFGDWKPLDDPPHPDKTWGNVGSLRTMTSWGEIVDGPPWPDGAWHYQRVGKKHAGAILDGREHREFPDFSGGRK